jgi:ribonuclease HI
MGWPMFLATLVYNRNVYWIRRFQTAGLLRRPRSLTQRLISKHIYTDATPTTIAAVFMGPPRIALVQHFTTPRNIAWAEMAAALKGLIWCANSQLEQPTTLTLFTDSQVVYHTIVKGTGITLRSSPLLQDLYVTLYMIFNKAGHSLVVRWIRSQANLADPLSRGVPRLLA